MPTPRGSRGGRSGGGRAEFELGRRRPGTRRDPEIALIGRHREHPGLVPRRSRSSAVGVRMRSTAPWSPVLHDTVAPDGEPPQSSWALSSTSAPKPTSSVGPVTTIRQSLVDGALREAQDTAPAARRTAAMASLARFMAGRIRPPRSASRHTLRRGSTPRRAGGCKRPRCKRRSRSLNPSGSSSSRRGGIGVRPPGHGSDSSNRCGNRGRRDPGRRRADSRAARTGPRGVGGSGFLRAAENAILRVVALPLEVIRIVRISSQADVAIAPPSRIAELPRHAGANPRPVTATAPAFNLAPRRIGRHAPGTDELLPVSRAGPNAAELLLVLGDADLAPLGFVAPPPRARRRGTRTFQAASARSVRCALPSRAPARREEHGTQHPRDDAGDEAIEAGPRVVHRPR